MATSPKAKLKILTDEEIVAADDLKETTIDVPEWGGAIKVKQLPREQWRKIAEDSVQNGEWNQELFELLIFIDATIEPNLSRDRAEQLRKKNAQVIDRLVLEVLTFCEVNADRLESLMTTFRGAE
jgi:hypothetical protein